MRNYSAGMPFQTLGCQATHLMVPGASTVSSLTKGPPLGITMVPSALWIPSCKNRDTLMRCKRKTWLVAGRQHKKPPMTLKWQTTK